MTDGLKKKWECKFPSVILSPLIFLFPFLFYQLLRYVDLSKTKKNVKSFTKVYYIIEDLECF